MNLMMRVCLFVLLPILLIIPNVAHSQENPCGQFNESLDLKHMIENGVVKTMCFDKEALSLVVSINATDAGELTLNIPKEIMNPVAYNCSADRFIVLVNGETSHYSETKAFYSRILSIQFGSEDSVIEIVETQTPESLSHQICKEKMSALAPLKQIAKGISFYDVVCPSDMILIKKLSKDSVACVKPQTVDKLVQRGWGTIPDAS